MATKAGDIRGKALWKKIRLTILARDNYTCAYCGAHPATTIDHIQPISHGGDPHNPDNLITACSRCNSSKGNRTNATQTRQTTTNQNLFSVGSSTLPLAEALSFSRGDMSGLPGNAVGFMSGFDGNSRDLTVNVLGKVPFE